MSDLLLPFLLLMDDDALAFWCFVSLMQRMGARHNFAVDERGIFGQLRLLGQVRTPANRVSHIAAVLAHPCCCCWWCCAVTNSCLLPPPLLCWCSRVLLPGA
jgi:hypothetical protein